MQWESCCPQAPLFLSFYGVEATSIQSNEILGICFEFGGDIDPPIYFNIHFIHSEKRKRKERDVWMQVLLLGWKIRFVVARAGTVFAACTDSTMARRYGFEQFVIWVPVLELGFWVCMVFWCGFWFICCWSLFSSADGLFRVYMWISIWLNFSSSSFSW